MLITTQHSGIERSGTTSVLLLLEWLLSGDPGAREILRRQNMIAMPVVNPDGYVAGSHANSMGQDPDTAWSLEGPKDPAKTPEAVAVQTMMDRHQPELHADIHGIDLAFPGHSMIEESGQAYSNVSLRSYQGIVDQMNAAAEAEGYPSDRLEQDAERIFWGPNRMRFLKKSGQDDRGPTPPFTATAATIPLRWQAKLRGNVAVFFGTAVCSRSVMKLGLANTTPAIRPESLRRTITIC